MKFDGSPYILERGETFATEKLNGGCACATVCVWWPRERQRAGGKDEEMLEGEEESPERREEAGGR